MWFFPFRGFHVFSLCFLFALSVIWLHSLSYFGLWADSSGVTHCIWCFRWELWIYTWSLRLPHTPDLSSLITCHPFSLFSAAEIFMWLSWDHGSPCLPHFVVRPWSLGGVASISDYCAKILPPLSPRRERMPRIQRLQPLKYCFLEHCLTTVVSCVRYFPIRSIPYFLHISWQTCNLY